MSKKYPGGIISGTGLKTPSATDASQNSGVWALEEQYNARTSGTWANPSGQTYEIQRSLRFKGGSYLNFTYPSNPLGNTYTMCYSFWVKRSAFGSDMHVLSSGGPNHAGGADISYMGFDGNDRFQFYHYPNGGTNFFMYRPANVFRDPAAWSHIVIMFDNTLEQVGDRCKIWFNGEFVSVWDSYTPATVQYQSTYYMSQRQQVIAHEDQRWRYPFTGYLAEFYGVDGYGLKLTADDFGYRDQNGVWQPKQFNGDLGTNGFYFKFADNTSATNLARNYNVGNYLTYSENVDDASYIKDRSSIVANNAVAPDGNTTADKLREDSTASNTHRYYKQYSVLPSGTVACASVYLKAAERTRAAVEAWSGSTYTTINVDLANGTITSVNGDDAAIAGRGMESVGNGWYRIWASCTSNGSGTPSIGVYLADSSGNITYTGNGSSGIHVWGNQVNLGTSPWGYTPTDARVLTYDWSTSSVTTADSMVDSPTNGSSSQDTGLGGQVSTNYPVLNPLEVPTNSSLASGNLQYFNQSGVGTTYYKGTTFWGRGKFYFEVAVTNGSATSVMNTGGIGVIVYDPAQVGTARSIGYGSNDLLWRFDGYKVNSGTTSSYGIAVNSNTDVVMCAYDTEEGKVWFGKNGTWFASSNPATNTSPAYTDGPRTNIGNVLKPYLASTHGGGGTAVMVANFGQSPFAYAAPAGFKCLSAANISHLNNIVDGTKYFDSVAYAGYGSGDSKIPLKFNPGLVWTKARNGGFSHRLIDSVRGSDREIYSDITNVESTNNSTVLSFDSDGYTLGTAQQLNDAAYNYASWVWAAGGNPTPQTPYMRDGLPTTVPTAGTVRVEEMSVNTKSQFSIITYRGTGADGSVAHGLNGTPDFIIWKALDDAYNWDIYHSALGHTATLIFTTATTRNVLHAAPTTTTIPVKHTYTGGSALNKRMVAYCWKAVEGFSRFGSWVNNNSTDGTFIYTGFRPGFILLKNYDNVEEWYILDSSRQEYNQTPPMSTSFLKPNSTSADSGSSSSGIDMLSNGFKIRTTNPASGEIGFGTRNYIYAAFAENPFSVARAR